jgi:hypothetical protein
MAQSLNRLVTTRGGAGTVDSSSIKRVDMRLSWKLLRYRWPQLASFWIDSNHEGRPEQQRRPADNDPLEES